MLKVLIVDDEVNMLHMLSTLLQEDGFETSTAQNAYEALELIKSNTFDFILSDVRMPKMDGLELLSNLKSMGVDSIVILMSAYGTTDLALEAIRKGAYDYISKPFKADEVTLTFHKAAEREHLRREVIKLKRRLTFYEEHPAIVAKSDQIKDILANIRQIAPHNTGVLITGESGTGKELLAREIHRLSPRNQNAFVPVHCGAIPANLLESELFGYVRGAFTGAYENKPGLFETADGGTLFLDEIGTTELSIQSKLLRVIENGEFRRIGDNVLRTISVRIIAATNTQLEKAIANGSFRTDLYYRLKIINLHVPPLRQRREDITPLIEFYIRLFNKKFRMNVTEISKQAQNALVQYGWKGNVRELQNVIERAMILSTSEIIDLSVLPDDITSTIPETTIAAENPEDFSLKKAYRKLEKRMILNALNKTGGNRSKAAHLLEISYPSLLQKMKDLGIT